MNRRLEINEFLFDISYIVLFSALFIEDIAFIGNTAWAIKGLKLISICVLVISTVRKRWEKKFLKKFFVGFAVGSLTLICTGDFFFFIVILLGFNSIQVKDENIYKLSYYCSILYLLITAVLYIYGVLPDVLSYRTDYSEEMRHSFGFVHSTVLPLLLCYVLIYYIAIKKEKARLFNVFVIALMGVIAYQSCKSRNAFAGIIAIVIMVLITKISFVKKWLVWIFKYTAEWIPIGAILLSCIPGILRYRGMFIDLWYKYDEIFTNRSLLAAAAIEEYGIQLINCMKYSEYVNVSVRIGEKLFHGLILDSAYLYILIRYGILMTCFVYIVLHSFYKNIKDNILIYSMFIILIVLNVTDNDMLSYGCLPVLVIGIRNV